MKRNSMLSEMVLNPLLVIDRQSDSIAWERYYVPYSRL